MAKGVKKIKWTGQGIVKKDSSIPNKKVVIAPDQHVFFEVDQWYDGTPETDKKKNVTWIFQDRKVKTIVLQKTLPSSNRYGIKLPKALCGPFEYYLEASLSGKRDVINQTGLLISGSCPAKIISSKWCTTNDGKDVRKEHVFSYGETVYLNLKTEGLNGNLNLSVDVFRNAGDGKIALFRYTSVDVIDGEINLEIKNTFSWFPLIKGIKETEEFYVKVFDPAVNHYIPNGQNETKHASFLKINKKIVSQTAKPLTNLSPLKTGEPDKNATRFEPCKFETITIIEDKKEDGKTTKVKALVFDNGKNLINKVSKKEPIRKSILFEFDKYDITADAKTVLNNILQFLLEHQFSSIKIDGHACVIGKENYNQKLSQQRSDAVKKLFVDGGLDARRITSIGHGEVNPTDDKQGRDNLKYRDEKEYKENRRVDISFEYYGHDAQTIVYETIAPSQDKNITIDITEYQNKACFREKGKHKKNIKINSTEYPKAIDQVADKLDFPVKSNLSQFNLFPLKYIWPKVFANEYNIHVHSCRYFSNDANSTVQVMVYPDIKWTLEFKWNHKEAFAYTYGNKLHQHDIKEGQKKVIGSEIDRGWSKNYREMHQSFELSLKAQWDTKSQTAEIGKEFADRIAKTLRLFNKIKETTEFIANSPLSKGKTTFEIKAPVIAVSVQWYLEKTKNLVGEIVEIGVETKPLVEAEFTINLFKIFIETAGNGVCPGAGNILVWILDKLGKEAGIHFLIIFKGNINASGQAIINILYPKKTTGEIKSFGTIDVTIEFKAWAKAGIGYLAFEGIIKADANTSITGGLKIGADSKGIYGCPVAEFGGIKATFVAIGTVKYGVFKKAYTYEGEAVLVQKSSLQFEKNYI
jgi:outer membrane protein OmpA-like peptidoglycan-associated protein